MHQIFEVGCRYSMLVTQLNTNFYDILRSFILSIQGYFAIRCTKILPWLPWPRLDLDTENGKPSSAHYNQTAIKLDNCIIWSDFIVTFVIKYFERLEPAKRSRMGAVFCCVRDSRRWMKSPSISDVIKIFIVQLK